MSADYYKRLRDILRQMDRFNKQLDDLAVAVDRGRSDLADLIAEVEQALARHSAGKNPLAGNPKLSVLELARERYAAEGAREIKFVSQADGDSSVVIDGQYNLKLTPLLDALLQILAQPDGISSDEFIPWKPRQQVRTALAAIVGRIVSQHALTELVRRLRNELEHQAKLPRHFVLVSKFGLRFALRRGPAESGA